MVSSDKIIIGKRKIEGHFLVYWLSLNITSTYHSRITRLFVYIDIWIKFYSESKVLCKTVNTELYYPELQDIWFVSLQSISYKLFFAVPQCRGKADRWQEEIKIVQTAE